MKIVKLTAENVKRLRAVEITPDGTVQVVTGRNAQGKTSVLDAIWYALGGGKASRETVMPIRAGESKARVALDLGDYTVIRTWTATGSTLTVMNADGAKYSSPQAILDSLVGRLSFDPLEFTRLSGRDQREALLGLVDIKEDLDELEVLRAKTYEQRTEVGRDVRRLGDVPAIDPDAPITEKSSSEILDRIQIARDAAVKIDSSRRAADKAVSDIEHYEKQIAALHESIAACRDALEKHQEVIDETPQPEDVTELRAELDEVEDHNRKVREVWRILEQRDEHDRLSAEYDRLTQNLTDMDHAKATLLSEAAFPIDGLGFDESGVTYRDVPFAQASSAEQIRVSLAMAMALNPTLRVIRILDGSLLDSESMQVVTDMAIEHDFQVWIERVDDRSESAVVIEDGTVQ